jgi:hypothetical protein
MAAAETLALGPYRGLLFLNPIEDDCPRGDTPFGPTLFEEITIAAGEMDLPDDPVSTLPTLQCIKTGFNRCLIAIPEFDQNVRHLVNVAGAGLPNAFNPTEKALDRTYVRAVAVVGIGPIRRPQRCLIGPVDATAIAKDAITRANASSLADLDWQTSTVSRPGPQRRLRQPLVGEHADRAHDQHPPTKCSQRLPHRASRARPQGGVIMLMIIRCDADNRFVCDARQHRLEPAEANRRKPWSSERKCARAAC